MHYCAVTLHRAVTAADLRLSAARGQSWPSPVYKCKAFCPGSLQEYSTEKEGASERDSGLLLGHAVCCGRNWPSVPGGPRKTPLFQANSCLALCLNYLIHEGAAAQTFGDETEKSHQWTAKRGVDNAWLLIRLFLRH